MNTKNSILLENRIKALEQRVTDLENYVQIIENHIQVISSPLSDESSQEEDIIKSIVNSVKSYIHKRFTNIGCVAIKSMLTEFFNEAGIISIDIENDKAFIYALRPVKCTEPNELWKLISEEIKQKYNYTLCIGLFNMKEPKGTQVFKYVDNAVDSYTKLIGKN